MSFLQRCRLLPHVHICFIKGSIKNEQWLSINRKWQVDIFNRINTYVVCDSTFLWTGNASLRFLYKAGNFLTSWVTFTSQEVIYSMELDACIRSINSVITSILLNESFPARIFWNENFCPLIKNSFLVFG